MLLPRGLVNARGLASAASAAVAGTLPRPTTGVAAPVKESVSVLPNGLTVASVDLNGAVSQLLIAFRAGTRYEEPDEVGLVHHLRNLIGTDSSNYLGVKLLWQAGAIGSNVISTASKDLLSVSMNVTRTYANVGLSLLGEFSQPALKAWDVVDIGETMKPDIEQQPTFEFVLELLHKAAYRNGALSRSVLAPLHRVGKINHQQLKNFANNRLVSSHAAIVGINVDHSLLLDYASNQGTIAEAKGSGSSQSAHYYGGDSRLYGDTPLAHVAIAGNGASLKNEKSVAAFAVLAQAIGKGPNLKFTDSPGMGVVAEAIYKAANHNSVGVNAINVVHSDTGLAGVYLVANGERIAPLIKTAVQSLKNLASSGVVGENLAIAKKLAQVEALTNANCSTSLAEDRAAQLLAGASPISPSDFAKSIEGISSEDVKKAAAQMVSKLSIAAYGKINQVPYFDEL